MKAFSQMSKLAKEMHIRGKVMKNKNLNAEQIAFVHEHIEPKYDNACGPCRLNVMLALDVPTELAFKILDASK